MRVYIQGPQLIHSRLARESPMLWCKMQGQLDSTGTESVDNPRIHRQSENTAVFQVLISGADQEIFLEKPIFLRPLMACFKKCHIYERKHLRVLNPRPKHPLTSGAEMLQRGARRATRQRDAE